MTASGAAEPLVARWGRDWAAGASRPVLRVGDDAWTGVAELDDRTRATAGRLAAAGVRPGDRVLLAMAPSIAFVVCHVAALRLGAVSVPTNPAATVREMTHVVRDSAPAVAIVDGGPDGPLGRWVAAAGAAESLAPVVLDGAGVTRTGPSDRADNADPVLDTVGPADPAVLTYTSGTTGVPKGAVLTHGNLAAGVDCLARAWAWGPDDRLAAALPLFHVHGLAAALHGALTTGGSLTLLPRFDAGALLTRVRNDAATMLFGVPTMYHRMAAHPDIGALRPLRLCVSGSAALSPLLWHAVLDATGQELLERYGMTETLLTLSNPLHGERRPGTVGQPLPGVQVRLAATDGADRGAGADGADSAALLQVRAPTVFAGYWQRPEATLDAFTTDGWFRTGDLASVDADGYLRIVGRDSDMIVSGGHNVYPQEVEEVLLGLPGLREAAVVGIPSPDLGEAVVAFVVADGTQAVVADQVVAGCAGQLSRYKVPRVVHLVTDLPRNSMGKVIRAELRKGAAPGRRT